MKNKAKIDSDEKIIAELTGEKVLEIVKILKKKKNISEFRLAELIKKDVNETRNLLYQLYHLNLVSFTRKKDKEKGWYIYYWTFMPRNLSFIKKKVKQKKIEKLREQIKSEKNNYWFCCDDKCVRLDIEQATTYDYRCPECGKIMQQEDNSERIKKLEAELKELQKSKK